MIVLKEKELYENMVVFDQSIMLKDILTKENYSGAVTYRDFLPEKYGGEDFLHGFAAYYDGILMPRDGDSYSLTDRICRYAFSEGELIVWLAKEPVVKEDW